MTDDRVLDAAEVGAQRAGLVDLNSAWQRIRRLAASHEALRAERDALREALRTYAERGSDAHWIVNDAGELARAVLASETSGEGPR